MKTVVAAPAPNTVEKTMNPSAAGNHRSKDASTRGQQRSGEGGRELSFRLQYLARSLDSSVGGGEDDA